MDAGTTAHQHEGGPAVDAIMIAEDCCGMLRRMVDGVEATAYQHVGSPAVDALFFVLEEMLMLLGWWM